MTDVVRPIFTLSLLTRFELTGPAGPVELPNKKLAGLLAYLACSAPVPQSREKLASLLWGSHFETQAQQNLRQALFRLRRALGPDALMSDGNEVWLAPGVIDCDVARLKALSGEASSASLAAAADLYRDPLLADVDIAEEAWADWLGAERPRLEGLALDAMIGHAEQALKSGKPQAALKAATRAVAVNALREDAHRLIMRALAATGRKAEALKHYQDLATVLKRELNAEPDALTKALVSELRSQPPNRSPAIAAARLEPNADAATPAAGDDQPSQTVARPVDLERRQLTIMVCNMVGSAPLSAVLDPESIHDLLVVFHKKVVDSVAPFGGFVAQYQGTGAHVYFGYPAAGEHDAEQAVRAALATLDAIGSLISFAGIAFRASVGIASGLVVVGDEPEAGDQLQRLAIGETPNIAMRLQAEAPPGEIVIAASTWRLTGQLFDCRALDAIEAKGLTQPIEAWRVCGEAPGVSRFDARRAGKLSPLVGRQEEHDLLLRRWQQAKLGEGRVVLLSGEAGIGKSRLAESLVAALEGESYARLRYFCSPHHVNSPLHPVIAQLELAAGFEPGSTPGARLERLEATFKPTSKNWPRDAALFAELLGVPLDGQFPAMRASPQQKREMTLAALLDQIDSFAAQGPVLIMLEDAHWIDPTSLDLAERMVTRVANRPVLLVATFRQEFQPSWADLPHVTMLQLSRLGLRDSAVIVRDIARDKALPDAIVEQIFTATDGVPLFTEELTTTLLESGLLRETADSYVLDHPRPGLAIPTTLQGSLVARLDRLGPGKDVAMIGAAIGRQFSRPLIGAVSALAADELDAALDRLTGSGLLSRRGTPPDATYSFKHALVRDAAYGTMLTSRRRQLHSNIAGVLVERFAALAENQPELVAHHFTEAGLAHEAIDYWLKAGRLAVARSADREAVASFEQALQLLDQQPQARETLQLGVDVRFDVKDALVLLGEFERIFPHLDEAARLARTLNDQKRLASAYRHLCHIHWMAGHLAESYRFGQDALAIARSLDDVPLQMRINLQLGAACMWRGDYRQAERILLTTLEWYERRENDNASSVRVRAAAHYYLTMVLTARGSFREGAIHGQEGIRLAEAEDRPQGIASAYLYAAGLETARGDFNRAIALLERARALCHQWNLAMLAVAGRGRLGQAYVLSGRLAEGIALLGQAASAFGIMQHRAAASITYAQLGQAYLLADRRADALDCARRSLAIASEGGQRGHEAMATWLFGEIAAIDGGLGQADGHYRDALALAQKIGFRPLVAHCHRSLAKLHGRSGTRERSSEHFAIATAMYREMDMQFYLQQVEAEKLQLP